MPQYWFFKCNIRALNANHRPGQSKVKKIRMLEMKKRKKLRGFSFLYKCSNFWSVSLEFKFEHKSFIWVVGWTTTFFENYLDIIVVVQRWTSHLQHIFGTFYLIGKKSTIFKYLASDIQYYGILQMHSIEKKCSLYRDSSQSIHETKIILDSMAWM